MADRLRRLDFTFERSPIYFVTACTAKRRKLLAEPSIHVAFTDFAEASEGFGAWVGAYVLMSDHIHLFVALDNNRLGVSQWMKSLKGTLSAHLRATGVYPPYWQKGFFDHVLRSGDSYSEKWHYVRENPVRAGSVSRWEDWPFAGEIFDLEFRRDRI